MVLNLIPSDPDRYEHVVELGEEFVEIKMVEFCIVWLCYGGASFWPGKWSGHAEARWKIYKHLEF